LKLPNWRSLRAVAVVAGSAGSIIAAAAVAPANASTGPVATQPPATIKVAVPQGVDAAALGATPVFPTPSATRETVSFVLQARNLSQLQAIVNRVMRHGFLSVRQFASRYGQPQSRISQLRSYLAAFGIKSASYADDLDVTATGTAGQFDKALSVSQREYAVKAVRAGNGELTRPAMTIHGTTDRPLLPENLATFVGSILGLTNYPIFGSSAVHTLTPEEQAAPHGFQTGNRTPANFAKQYGLTPLYKMAAEGQRQTIGIITYASLRPQDPTHFWSAVLRIRTKAGRIRLDNIDGGSGAVSYDAGSGETTLDVEQAGALAPDANIVVYQAPNTDYGSADAFFAAASQDAASTISTSWGYSEIGLQALGDAGQEAATYGRIFDEAYLEMAAQGQTAFDTAGDTGAYDDAGDATPYTELSVDNPGDSPWVTTVGGTTNPGEIPLYDSDGVLRAAVRIKAQRTWGWDWMYPYYALFGGAAGPYTSESQFAADPANAGGTGGGYSTTELRPGYQRQIRNIGDFTAVPYLRPGTPALFPGTKSVYLPTMFTAWDAGSASPSSAPPALVTGYKGGRAVPDLVADADPYTGYEEYFSGFPGAALQYGWGGTSFVAPQMAGAAAVIDSYLGRRAGFWNPASYRFAAGHGSPFTPLDSASAANDNLFYTGTAGHVFNPGSGLGTPNLAKLAADLRALG
jgi:kumamolisin